MSSVTSTTTTTTTTADSSSETEPKTVYSASDVGYKTGYDSSGNLMVTTINSDLSYSTKTYNDTSGSVVSANYDAYGEVLYTDVASQSSFESTGRSFDSSGQLFRALRLQSEESQRRIIEALNNQSGTPIEETFSSFGIDIEDTSNEQGLTDRFLLLMQLTTDLSESISSYRKSEVEGISEKEQNEFDRMEKKIKKMQRKAKNAAKTGNIMQGLAYAGAALAVVAAVAITVATAGAAAPLAAFMIAMAIDTIVGQQTGHSATGYMSQGYGKIYEAMGMSKEDAQMAGAIHAAVALIAMSIAMGNVGGAAAAGTTGVGATTATTAASSTTATTAASTTTASTAAGSATASTAASSATASTAAGSATASTAAGSATASTAAGSATAGTTTASTTTTTTSSAASRTSDAAGMADDAVGLADDAANVADDAASAADQTEKVARAARHAKISAAVKGFQAGHKAATASGQTVKTDQDHQVGNSKLEVTESENTRDLLALDMDQSIELLERAVERLTSSLGQISNFSSTQSGLMTAIAQRINLTV